MESVRTATLEDLDVLVELAAALDAEIAPMRGGAIWHVRDARDPEGDVGRELTSLLADPDVLVLVGSIDAAVVGFAVVEFERLRDASVLARVTELYVLPGAREVGVGEALADAIVDASRARGCIGIDAPALPGHRSTKNFFERQGFTARMLTMHKPLRGGQPASG